MLQRSSITRVALAACLAWALGWRALGPEHGESGRRSIAVGATNVLLVTIDTLRADRFGAGLTPAIDALASRGLRFTRARTVAPLTLPAHVSLMTGLIPPVHGVRENGTYRFEGGHPTLARLLRKAGLETAAFAGAYVLDRRFGLTDGFDAYDDQIERDRSAPARLEEAAATYRAVLAAPARFARERNAAAKLLASLQGRGR